LVITDFFSIINFFSDFKSILAEFGDFAPLLGCNYILREEVGTHSYAGSTGLKPAAEVLLGGFYATCHHNLAPRHRGAQTLYESGTEHIAREDLAEVAAHFLSLADLADAAATGAVGDEPAVADGAISGLKRGPTTKLAPSWI